MLERSKSVNQTFEKNRKSRTSQKINFKQLYGRSTKQAHNGGFSRPKRKSK